MTLTDEGSRQSERAAATRRSLLDAAREVFGAAGFAEASIADVVARAGASVGSLYHHFGGKADLYLALYENFCDSQESRAAAAGAVARSCGVSDPMELFVVGTRAYLLGCWEQREVARMFLAGGGPSGFELITRRRNRAWITRNATLLRVDTEPMGEALVLVLTTIVGEAGWEVSVSDDELRAHRLIDDVCTLIGRIGG